MREITEALFALRDEKYRAFHAALMPGVAWERVIGVRMPALRRYAAALPPPWPKRRRPRSSCGSCPTPTTRKIISMPCC